jgi:hypothetical protein
MPWEDRKISSVALESLLAHPRHKCATTPATRRGSIGCMDDRNDEDLFLDAVDHIVLEDAR